MGRLILFQSKQIRRELDGFHRTINHQSASDSHRCQATGLHPSLPPPLFLTKCHFTFPSRRKFKAAHRDNLQILTPQVRLRHFPPPLSFSRPRPSSAPAFAPTPPPSPILAHSPFLFPHFTHTAPSPRLSGWFQACCVWPDLVSCNWNSNYDSLPIAFPPSEKSCYLSSAAWTLLSMLTCMRTRQWFSELRNY